MVGRALCLPDRSIILFAVCQGILLYCAGWTVYQTVPHTAEGWTNIGELFSNRTFLDLAMSLMATYGLYLISSLMYLEPWHMITSFIQYLFLLPSYVNILLIYAFCNLHDVSWGTKGDNGAAKDLGQAKKVKNDDGEEALEVALPTRQEDVEALWLQARSEIRIPQKEVKEKRDASTKRSDCESNRGRRVRWAMPAASLNHRTPRAPLTPSRPQLPHQCRPPLPRLQHDHHPPLHQQRIHWLDLAALCRGHLGRLQPIPCASPCPLCVRLS